MDNPLADTLESEKSTRCKYWSGNLIRSLTVLLTVIVVLYVSEYLDKVISIAGAIFGMTNVLLMPALCHLKLVADTPC